MVLSSILVAAASITLALAVAVLLWMCHSHSEQASSGLREQDAREDLKIVKLEPHTRP